MAAVPGWRALLSGAWRGAMVPAGIYALVTVPLVVVGRLRGDPSLGLAVAATAVALTYALTALFLSTVGATAYLLLARFGRAGPVSFTALGSALMLAAGALAPASAPLDAPYLGLLALHGGTAAAAMWWSVRRRAT